MPETRPRAAGRRPGRSRRPWIVGALVVLLAGGGLWWSNRSAGPTDDGVAWRPKQNAGTAVVERRDLFSVVALNSTVVAAPEFALTAPVAGVFSRRLTPAALVPAGEVLGWVTAAGRRNPVRTPVEATVLEYAATHGATVPAGMPLITLKASGYGIRGTVADALIYRLTELGDTASAQIDHGPGPFSCPMLGGPVADDAETGGQLTVTCAAPLDLRLFAGLKGVLAIRTGEAKAALALPVEAVAGTAERGRVTLRDPGGEPVEREVLLGVTDGSWIQITEGLAEGDQVAVPAPLLPEPGEG